MNFDKAKHKFCDFQTFKVDELVIINKIHEIKNASLIMCILVFLILKRPQVEQGRIGKAESEARLRLLRSKASEKYGNVNIHQSDGHINLFCEQQNKTGNR